MPIDSAKAESIVITEDTTWSQNSLIVVDGSEGLVISPDVTLTIEDGVMIKLAQDNTITVQGNLDINGTAENPVIITSLKNDQAGGDTNGDGDNTTPAPGDWGAILISNPNSNIDIDHATIEYAGDTNGSNMYLGIMDADTVNIDHSNIINNLGLMRIGNVNTINIENSNIHNPDFCQDMGGQIFCGSSIMNTGTTEMQAINNYWGHVDGPTLDPSEIKGTFLQGGFNYEPYLTEEWTPEPPQPERNPVIIVPGIIGSRLEYVGTNNEIWPDVANMLLPGDDYLDDLALPEEGYPYIFNIEPSDILRDIGYEYLGIGIYKDYFAGLISELEMNGYEEGVDLFVFPYDWRLDIDYLAGQGAGNDPNTLVNKIYEVKDIAGSDKIDIIAHSMGGLVVKRYMNIFGTSSVETFIDIATPHFGSVNAAKTLNYGNDFEIIFLNSDKIQEISQNMPSIYQLLPSQSYFNSNDSNYNSYIADLHDIDSNGVTGNLNYQESLDFLVNQGRKFSLIEKNNELHNQIDNFSFTNSYNIVGLGEPTMGKIYTLNEKGDNTFEYALKYINGDGTVPLRSAEAFFEQEKAFSSNIIYVSSTTHSYIPSIEGVPELIVSILNNDIDNFDYSEFDNISLDKENFKFEGKSVSYHCPIDLHVYDQDGNHVGPDENGNIEMSIPGVKYDIIEDNIFTFLPYGREYIVRGEAREPGIFNARIESIEGNEYIEKIYFSELFMDSTSTEIEFNIIDDQEEYAINIDQNGDGTFDQEAEPSAILEGEEINDIVKPETSIIISGALGSNNYYISTTTIELIATDSETGSSSSGILNTKYSLDSGQTWKIYESLVTLENNGTNTIIYYSIDRAGNKEIPKTEIIKVDATAPNIDIIYPKIDVPVFHSEILNIEYITTDNYSGVNASTTEIYFDNELIDSVTVDMFYKSLGKHTIKIVVQDNAGNEAEKEIYFKVITDIDDLTKDVDRIFEENLINDKAYKKISKDLDKISKYIEKSTIRNDKRSQRQENILEKCIIKKGEEWCENKPGKTFDRINNKIDKISQKFIKFKYKLLSKKLDIYLRVKWLSFQGHDIIKEDVEYLINKLK